MKNHLRKFAAVIARRRRKANRRAHEGRWLRKKAKVYIADPRWPDGAVGPSYRSTLLASIRRFRNQHDAAGC